MNPEVEALKNRGNEHFQKAKYLDAIDCYTAAIIIDPNHVISLGNRSACYLALQRYDEADADARRALILDKTYLKGYFRLASSLKARKLYIEAAGVASLGLDVDPDNAPLRKIKTACTKESAAQTNANSKKIFGNLYNDKNSSSHKSGDGSHSSRPKSNAMSSSSKANKIADSTSASKSGLSEIENKMLHSVKTLVSRLQNGDFSSSEADLHMLQGTFRKLVDTDTFADLVFPGVPADVLKGLPCTLNELLQWKSMSMMVDEAMPKVAIAAGKIFEGVKARGEARGDRMDAATQVVLIPQIAQESFAREVVEIVRNLSKRVSSMNARLNLTLASPSNEAATLDQLDGDIFGPLMGRDGVAIQDYFLDDEWSSLVLDDVTRYAKTEKMTETSFSPQQVSTSVRVEELDDNASAPTTTACVGTDKARIAWLEAKDIQSLYPALAEAIHNLHSLPFEINAKSNSAMSLLEPGHGLTMLAHIPVGGTQPARFDNHVGKNDSGLRLSCAYHLVPEGATGGAAVSGSQGTSAAQYVLTTDHDEVKADVVHDRLVLYKSLDVKNMRTVATREYFVLYFYILGKCS